MTAALEPAHVIDESHVEFMMGGVSINVAARDAHNVPTLTRALGCRVSADRRCVTLLVPVSDGARLLDDVRANGAIAAVFSRPSTHQTIQLKGADARIVALEPGDAGLMERYVLALAADLAPLGHPEAYVRAMLGHDDDDVTAVSFTPSAAFNQTPGPVAGSPLGATAPR
jgi:hypothetical protein